MSYPLSFFFTVPAPTEIYTLSLHDALPIYFERMEVADAPLGMRRVEGFVQRFPDDGQAVSERTIVYVGYDRSEEHTSELQSRGHLVCRLLLEKKKKKKQHK